MNKILLVNKKKWIFCLFILITSFSYGYEINNKVITENNYRKKSNWIEVINHFSEVTIEYKIQNIEELQIVTELHYYAKKQNGECITLGSFTKTEGFLNSEGKEFILDSNLTNDSEFFRTRLIGLSLDCIEKPFSLKGIALSSDNKIYETETLCRLYINCEKQSLEEWFPDI